MVLILNIDSVADENFINQLIINKNVILHDFTKQK